MYISEVNIGGYRNFLNAKIPLHEGINIVIGSNNVGKSNLLQAIALVLHVNHHIDVNDIFCETDVEKLKANPPMVSISVVIRQSTGESETSQEASLLRDYMTKLEAPYEAQLNFQYSLSSDQIENYRKDVTNLDTHQKIWELIKKDYARFYLTYRWGKNGPAANDSMRELLERCDLQFLEALRDVGKNMFMGYNPMLRDVLNFFVDYKLKTDTEKSEDEIKEGLRQLQQQFKDEAKPLMDSLKDRLADGKKVLLDYAKETGASFGNVVPDFSGNLSESELFAVLKLIIKHETGVEIPATHNGLGYNNLIFMSLLLAKMQASADGNYMKRQAKLYSLLAIEEPEAHLHPAMQYQFLDFLNKNRQAHNVTQVIVTTHSPQIVSAVSVDDVICLHSIDYGKQKSGYPRLLFKDNEDDKLSKAYVQRYLDATRSDMFFANKLIFVEGMAEEILIPTFAKYLGFDLAKEHVLVVNMGGRYYNHFIKLFDSREFWGINKKVACITDIDPCCESESCYPFEYGIVDGRSYSRHADAEIAAYADHPNIRYFRQNETYGKTLEYDIALHNPNCKQIIVKEMSNRDELMDLMSLSTLDDIKNRLRRSDENQRIKTAIDANTKWDDEEKKKAIIASRYLNSVSKGGNALALSLVLEENRMRKEDDENKFTFVVPQYIEDALRWLLS